MQGLIRTQDPENDMVKNYGQCEKLYKRTIEILNSTPVVANSLSLSS